MPKNDFTRKMKDFDTFTKIALECGQFGLNNCCHRLWKVAQIAINHPIWSHYSDDTIECNLIYLSVTLSSCCNFSLSVSSTDCFMLNYSSVLKNRQSPASFPFILSLFKQTLQFLQEINVKMSIQYLALGFELMVSRQWVSSLNHQTRAPTHYL